jgi:succinate dehydrogenase/fumarate reductase flavoprotein subunit
MVGHGLRVPPTHENHVRELDPKLPERIRKGEIILPLYADLSRLPESERRAIFGLMVGNEGKTRIPVYETLCRAGFDPDKDMLQVPVMNPEAYGHANFWAGMNVPHWRQWGCGGLMVDWNLATNIEGLYAAGGAIFGAGAHSSAAASGRYAGRKAAQFSQTADQPAVAGDQIDREKERVYAPLKAKGLSIGWKELNAGICRIMQEYCGQYKSEETLKEGLSLLAGVREAEAKSLQAVNPHELARCVECLSIITSCEAVLQACLARRASSGHLNFFRLDYPDIDPPAWRKHLVVRLSAGGPEVREVPLDYHLRAPFAPSYEENYETKCIESLRKGGSQS